MICPICTRRPIPRGYHTCGNSYCQEADYHTNVAKNARKGSKKKTEHYAVASQLAELSTESA